MTMRLHEIHPAMVHAPLVLMPAAICADMAGVAFDNQNFLDVGRTTMVLAAGSALVSGAFGFIAEQEVNLSDEAGSVLDSHRNINVAATSISAAMTIYRLRRDRPGPLYLAAGLGTLAAVYYSAYLGAKMVYQHGVGVETSNGVDIDESIELRPRTFGTALRAAGRHFGRGIKRFYHDWFGSSGIVPTDREIYDAIEDEDRSEKTPPVMYGP